MTKTPSDHELLAFFETEPEILDPGIPWVYNRLTFNIDRTPDKVTTILCPADGILQFRWVRDHNEIVSLDITGITEISIKEEYGTEILEALFPDKKQLKPLRLQLKPFVRVTWGT